MDIRAYEVLSASLQSQIGAQRSLIEDQRRKIDVENKLKLISSQVTSLQPLIDTLQKLGRQPEASFTEALIGLKKEEQTLRIELDELADRLSAYPQPQGQQTPVVADPALIADLDGLIAEINKSNIADMTDEERYLIFDQWALRWRITVEKLGQDAATIDLAARTAYRLIKEATLVHPAENHFIRALNKDLKEDWSSQLERTNQELQVAHDRAKKRKEAEGLFEQLKSIRPETYDGGKTAEKFLSLVRCVSKDRSLRDDLAKHCLPFRKELGEEFAFLWKEEDEEPISPTHKLTNRDILARIFRRMISKTLIGGCHGPLEAIYQGFPSHDKGRAKEAVELLIRRNIVKLKPSNYGDRVSIYPRSMPYVAGFCEGRAFGICAIDAWSQRV